MAYTVGFPPERPTESILDRPCLRQRTGDTGDERGSARSVLAEIVNHNDPYAQQFNSALTEICRSDSRTGLIIWLSVHNRPLYRKLTGRLPDEIHRLWSEHASLEKFGQAVEAWTEAYGMARELFTDHANGSQGPVD